LTQDRNPIHREDYIPTRRELLAIGLSALGLRVVVFAVVILWFHIPFQTYANAADGQSYQHYAQAILGDRSQLTVYDTRVFPGYPLLIAMVNEATRVGIAPTALGVTWISAAAAAVLAAVLFRDRRIGWAMVMLIPHWPINSSLAMSEAPMLAVVLSGLVLGVGGYAMPSGALLGFAVLVRPAAVFPLAGFLVARWFANQRRQALTAALVSAVVIAAGLLFVKWLMGDAMHSLKVYSNSPSAYAGAVFAWPFQALIETPIRAHASAARIVYIWAQVALVLGACAMLAAKVKSSALDRLAFLWLGANVIFTLCIASGPFGWGFYHFPRFTIPALPPLFWAVRRVLPSATWAWMVLLIACGAITIAGVHEGVIALPSPPLPGY
jgi:hypothetical protein